MGEFVPAAVYFQIPILFTAEGFEEVWELPYMS